MLTHVDQEPLCTAPGPPAFAPQPLFDRAEECGTSARIAVWGTGYMGANHAAGLAELGHSVAAFDVDPLRLSALRRGVLPFHEPGLADLVVRNVERGRLRFVADGAEAMDGAEFAFICVGTPSSPDGSADMTAFDRAVSDIIRLSAETPYPPAPAREPGVCPPHRRRIVLIKSTVPVGTAERLKQRIAGAGADLDVVSAPEYLAEGSAVRDTLNPHKLVIGADDEWAARRTAALYGGRVPSERIVYCSNTEAEIAKLANNLALAARVTLINELANLVASYGADVTPVARALGLDPRIGPNFLEAGDGWGGSCFLKDIQSLLHGARMLGVDLPLTSAVPTSNAAQQRQVGRLLLDYFGGNLTGRVIAVLGLAFKPGTDDLRCSSSMALVAQILQAGGTVRAFDAAPGVREQVRQRYTPHQVQWCEGVGAAACGADAACLMHAGFAAGLDLTHLRDVMRTPLLLDPRRAVPADDVRNAGFDCLAIGRPPILASRTAPAGGGTTQPEAGAGE